MKIYVAAKFEDKERVRDAMGVVESRGHEVTYDWTLSDATGLSGTQLHEYLMAEASADLKAVVGCDALILFPHPKSKGAFVELGVALALRKKIYVVRPYDAECIFLVLPQITHVESVEQAINHMELSNV